MYQLEKMPLIGFLLNILKLNFATYDWFWTDGSHILNSTDFKCSQNIKLYHFVRTILSIPFCPMPFCPYTILSATILSVPFCPLPFCPVTPRHICTALPCRIWSCLHHATGNWALIGRMSSNPCVSFAALFLLVQALCTALLCPWWPGGLVRQLCDNANSGPSKSVRFRSLKEGGTLETLSHLYPYLPPIV